MDHESNDQTVSQSENSGRTQSEQDRLQAIGDRQQVASLLFRELVEASDTFGYWRARAKVDGLWELTMMDRDLAAQSSSREFSELRERLDTLLPITEDERNRLAGKMRHVEVPGYPELADRWYADRDKDSEEARLLQEWSEWIDHNFPPHPQAPTNNGTALVALLRDIEPIIVDTI